MKEIYFKNTKQYTFYWLMCIWIVGRRVPVTGMLAGMNLSKPGMNLSKPGMNLSKPGKKHHNHVIIYAHTCVTSGYCVVLPWSHWPSPLCFHFRSGSLVKASGKMISLSMQIEFHVSYFSVYGALWRSVLLLQSISPQRQLFANINNSITIWSRMLIRKFIHTKPCVVIMPP